MSNFASGQRIKHPIYGTGDIIEVMFGENIRVRFHGGDQIVKTSDFEIKNQPSYRVGGDPLENDNVLFRRALEAIILGVVPPDSKMLLQMTIDGDQTSQLCEGWFQNASEHGLCKVVYGDYGFGKSHFLRFAKAIALKNKWCVASLELDPKSVDPAKPHLIYRAIANSIVYPSREDGRQSRSFADFIDEIRRNWSSVQILSILNKSGWFKYGLEALMYSGHGYENEDYRLACQWLSGDKIDHNVIKGLSSSHTRHASNLPRMPRTKETADIYVFHLVVIHHLLRSLGYSGLLLILDEAEHVRGFNTKRRERANNFFDLLSRSAHKPLRVRDNPIPNEHGHEVPTYWNTGPHFGVLVGLTEDDSSETRLSDLRDKSSFLHSTEDIHRLHPPSVIGYENWCREFLNSCATNLVKSQVYLNSEKNIQNFVKTLASGYESENNNELVLRKWIKLAALVPALALSKATTNPDEALIELKKSIKMVLSNELPWDN